MPTGTPGGHIFSAEEQYSRQRTHEPLRNYAISKARSEEPSAAPGRDDPTSVINWALGRSTRATVFDAHTTRAHHSAAPITSALRATLRWHTAKHSSD